MGKMGQSDRFECAEHVECREENTLIRNMKAILPVETPPELEEFTIGDVSEMFKLGIARKSGTDNSKSFNVRTLSTDLSIAPSASLQPSLVGHELSTSDIYRAVEYYAHMFESRESVPSKGENIANDEKSVPPICIETRVVPDSSIVHHISRIFLSPSLTSTEQYSQLESTSSIDQEFVQNPIETMTSNSVHSLHNVPSLATHGSLETYTVRTR